MSAITALVDLVTDYDLVTYRKSGRPEAQRGGRLYFRFDRPRASDQGGHYEHYPSNGANTITIFRPGISHPTSVSRAVELAAASPAPEDELCYVVHELGHHHSNLSGTFVPFPQQDPRDTYAEEVRAWAIGARILVARGWRGSWDSFKKIERSSLEGYRCGMSLDPDGSARIEQGVRRQVESWSFSWMPRENAG
jgi:hypothetical protein